MQVLRWTFMLITLCGCWRLPSWNSTPWRYLYNVYTWTCTLLTLLLLVGEILDLVLTVDNRSDLSENLFKTMTFAVDCYKLATILSSRENIETLMDILESEPFAPVSDEELEIRTKFDKSAEILINPPINVTENVLHVCRKVMKIYMTGLDVWSAWTVLGSLAVNFTSRKLLYRVWLPFEYKSATIFSLVYLHHALITVFSITLAVAYDSLFTGLMIHIYSQFEILGYRLRNVHRMADDSVKHCVRHHDQIYKFVLMLCIGRDSRHSRNSRRLCFNTLTAKSTSKKSACKCHSSSCLAVDVFANMVNDEFKSVTFIQFFMTTGVMCFSLYQLSLSEHSGNLADVFFYGSCLLLQIFYFCWFGNEVKLKSLEVADMIFESEWTLLNDSTKRILLMMMRRATVPIEFTSNHIVSMNVEAFKTLIKTSYSVFNLLRQN
nr:odorant receptor 46a-like [Megalopta genalis]